MTLATIVAGILLIPSPVYPAIRAGFKSLYLGQTQSQSSAPASSEKQTQNSHQNPVKPCSAAQSASSPQPDCKAAPHPTGKKHPNQKAAKSTRSSPSKTVVTNGGTGEPIIAISSEEGQRRAARVRDTNRLLDAADLNLKDVAVRGITAGQEVTVKQIRSYMDQAKDAVNSGDLERAYTLANKANMLAADLNTH